MVRLTMIPMARLMVIFVAGLLLVWGVGCSGGGGPVSPTDIPQAQGHMNPQTHLWGYWTVRLDPATGGVEASVDRSAMFTANVVNFLNGKPGSLGVKIDKTVAETEYTDVEVDVSITHPFPGMPQYDGYDARGVFMGDGSGVLWYNSDLKYALSGTDQLMLPDPDYGIGGPDGYTRWFNKPEFSTGGMPLFQYTKGNAASGGFAGTATLNPYKYFADGLQAYDDLWTWISANPDSRGVFSSGDTNTRTYYLRFPKTKGIIFGYAVVANWEAPDMHPSNAPEAVAMKVVDNSTVYYVSPSDKGGDIKLEVSVWNWGGTLSGGIMDEYGIKIDSTVLSSPYAADDADMTPIGGGENYQIYQLDIPADNIQGIDGQELWVIAEERYFDYTNDFGTANLADADRVAAFFRFPLAVSNEHPECPVPKPSAIDPPAHISNGSVDCHMTSTNLAGTSGIQVYLDKAGTIDGTYDIAGTDISNVDVSAGTLDATFDMTGATPGEYYVVLTNSCGKTGASDAPLFTITEYVVGDFYVSNHSDFTGLPEEGTMQHPFHTINGALAAADADGTDDDVILVDYGQGRYPELIYSTIGHYTLRAYNWHSPSGRPAIGGLDVVITNWQNYGAITLGGCHNVTIQGFKLLFVTNGNGGNSDIINQYGGGDIAIRDCWFSGDTQDGASYCAAITIYYVDGTVIENNLFKGINMPHPIPDMSGVRIYAIDFQVQTDIRIVKNEFTEFQAGPSDGRDVSLHTGYEGGTYGNYAISNNLYHHIFPETSDAGQFSYVGINYFGYYQSYDDPVWPFEIAHNTFDHISTFGAAGGVGSVEGIDSWGITAGFDFAVHSNILTNFQSGYSLGINDPNLADYNDLWQGPVWGGSQGVGNISQDPKYVNNTTEPYDYHLQAGSPCIDTGKDGEDMGCYGGLGPGEKVGLLTPEE